MRLVDRDRLRDISYRFSRYRSLKKIGRREEVKAMTRLETESEEA